MHTKCDNIFVVHVEGKQVLVRRAPAQAGAHCMKKFSATHHATTVCHRQGLDSSWNSFASCCSSCRRISSHGNELEPQRSLGKVDRQGDGSSRMESNTTSSSRIFTESSSAETSSGQTCLQKSPRTGQLLEQRAVASQAETKTSQPDKVSPLSTFISYPLSPTPDQY